MTGEKIIILHVANTLVKMTELLGKNNNDDNNKNGGKKTFYYTYALNHIKNKTKKKKLKCGLAMNKRQVV